MLLVIEISMSNSKEYKVLEAVEIDGTEYAVDDVVSLTDEIADPLVAEGKLEPTEDTEEEEEV